MSPIPLLNMRVDLAVMTGDGDVEDDDDCPDGDGDVEGDIVLHV